MTPKRKGTIRNRFKILLAEKETREGRNYTYRDIADATGIATSTLTAYANQTAGRYDGGTLAALYEFLDCRNMADLLEYVPGLRGSVPVDAPQDFAAVRQQVTRTRARRQVPR